MIKLNDFVQLTELMRDLAAHFKATRPAMHPSLMENAVKRYIEAKMLKFNITGVVFDVRQN